jgi:hypothetical protein
VPSSWGGIRQPAQTLTAAHPIERFSCPLNRKYLHHGMAIPDYTGYDALRQVECRISEKLVSADLIPRILIPRMETANGRQEALGEGSGRGRG